MSIENRVLSIIKRHVINVRVISCEDSLRDLGIDSIGLVELIMDLEDELKLQFNDDLLSMEVFKTVGDVITIVETSLEL